MIYVAFIIFAVSHGIVLFMFERQRKQLDSLRFLLRRKRELIEQMETELKLASAMLKK